MGVGGDRRTHPADEREGLPKGDHLEAAGAALEALDAETLIGLYVDGFVFEDVAAGEIISTRVDLFVYSEALFSGARCQVLRGRRVVCTET